MRQLRLFCIGGCVAALIAWAIRLFVHTFASPLATGEINPPPTTSSSAPTFVISRGGVYSGDWSSDDPAVPAVSIKTAQPVTIENSTIRGGGNLIATAVDHAKIILRNNHAVGVNPNAAGQRPGRFFYGEKVDSVRIENNDISHTSGIELHSYSGDFQPDQTIQILRNVARNIDGRLSDGHNGWLDFNERTPLAGGKTEKGFDEVHFVILDNVRRLGGIEIAWNQVICDPGESRVEDVINIYLSSGTHQSPISIHDNYIQGAYTIRPWQANTQDQNYKYDWQYNGGGILLGDGTPESSERAPAFVEAFANQVVGTSNYGIAIAAGHDLAFHDNRIVSCGFLPDGRYIPSQNVGAYIWDTHHGARLSPPAFFNNSGRRNIVGWVSSPDKTKRNDWWHPDATHWDTNIPLPDPITRATEEAEYKMWTEKLALMGVSIGAAKIGKR